MKKETQDEINEAFKTAVRRCVAQGNHAKWGEGESLEVIEELVGVLVSSEDASLEGFASIRAKVALVVNPSAFAQFLEKQPLDHPSHIRRPKRGTGGSKAGVEV